MGLSFHFIETTKEDELAVQVDYPEVDWVPSLIPAIGTAMSGCAFLAKERIHNEWLPYVFSKFTQGGAGFVQLVFVKAKTEEERNTAYKSIITYQDHPWPAVLKALQFQIDKDAKTQTNNSLGKVYTPIWYLRKAYIPAVVYNSKVQVDTFISDTTPFTDEEMAHTQPVPTEVEWDFANTRGSIVCLHDEVTVPSKGGGYSIAYDSIPTAAAPAPGPDRIFPKTNFKSWSSFILDDSQSQDKSTGQWIRTRLRIFPPPTPKVILE